jgi:hypothetical protein
LQFRLILVFCNSAEERKKTMKKIVILSAMMFAVALWFGCTVSAGTCPPTDFINDGCGDEVPCETPISGSRDVNTVTVASDGTKITVTVVLCGNFSNNTKYRVHFDYKDASGDLLTGFVGPTNAQCATPEGTTSDDTIMLRRGKTTGPEENNVSAAGNTLIFEVLYEDLVVNGSPGILQSSDTVYIWVDTHYKGIQDRAPSTDCTDGCSKPQVCGEVIQHQLN